MNRHCWCKCYPEAQQGGSFDEEYHSSMGGVVAGGASLPTKRRGVLQFYSFVCAEIKNFFLFDQTFPFFVVSLKVGVVGGPI